MIITCPHCQTKYQVTYEAIGSAGRKVQCAHCQQAWQQNPISPSAAPERIVEVVDAIAEDSLDEALAAEEAATVAEQMQRVIEEETRSQEAGKVDPSVIRKRQLAFSRRQNAIEALGPLAKLRRTARFLGVLLLVAIAATAYFGRVQVVERFPQMAGVYEAAGLKVNVIGLDFSNLSTLRSLRDGKEMLSVSAQIVGVAPGPVKVPPVVITLIDAHNAPIYQWSVTPSVRDLMAGERATFDTQLALPPGDAARVRLNFGAMAPARSISADSSAREPAPAPAAPAQTLPEHR